MAKRLFIGGLPYEATDTDLKGFFAKVGEVTSANIIIDKFSGRSKGFGFVEMAKNEDADKAIKELNETEMGGRRIMVQEARPQEERAPRRDFGGDRRGGGDFGGRGGGSRGGGRDFQRGKRW
ncbi:RNA recognition motif domain-containing protein [Patescibacteria group bacterium]